jgi:hypothetical protein
MKIIKGLGLFSVLVLVASACFDPPEYPNTPHIELESLRFYSEPNGTDSLVLSITFEDGDGDLGISTNDFDPPYHANNFYIGNNGQLAAVPTYTQYFTNPTSSIDNVLQIPDNVNGKLVTYKFIENPLYPNLPQFIFPATCLNYKQQALYVWADDNVVDNTYTITDTITVLQNQGNGIPPLKRLIYKVEDIFYYTDNPNYENITVQFWVLNAKAQYEMIDWRTFNDRCGVTFNGRFTRLSTETNPLAGTLRYSMRSEALAIILGGSTFKLKVQIRDRALNLSNEIDTGDNNLSGLR